MWAAMVCLVERLIESVKRFSHDVFVTQGDDIWTMVSAWFAVHWLLPYKVNVRLSAVCSIEQYPGNH